jgi:hypothetical protein
MSVLLGFLVALELVLSRIDTTGLISLSKGWWNLYQGRFDGDEAGGGSDGRG